MSLTPRVLWGDLDLTDYPYSLIFGSDLGAPEPVTQVLSTFLRDGEYEITDRSSNRTLTLPIATEGADMDELGAAEAALVLEARKPLNTLTIDPGDGFGVPTVFDTFAGDVRLSRKDEYEQNNLRVWDATIAALPFGRDQSLTSVQATSGVMATPVTVSIDNGSSTTGWVSPQGYAVTSSGGRVSATAASGGLFLDRSGLSVDISTTRYIQVDWAQDQSAGSGDLYVVVSGVTAKLPLVAFGVSPAGMRQSIFQIPASMGSTLTVLTFGFPSLPTGGTLSIDQVTRTNVVPGSGTNRQQSRSLTVGGSARARASLIVTAGIGTTLGDTTVLYTRTAATGLQPPLRPYRYAHATPTVDAALLSGARNDIGSTMSFMLPANRFQEAAHLFAARLRATTAGTYTLTYSAALVSSTAAPIPDTAVTIGGSIAVTFPSANVWQFSEIGLMQLLPVPVAPDSTHMLRLTVVASSAVVEIDEGYLFDLDNGVLSWVKTTGLTRLEVRTADLRLPRPSYWGGSLDGGGSAGLVRSDWRVQAYGSHVFEPGQIEIFTVTSGTETSACSVSYYRSFHTHAAA